MEVLLRVPRAEADDAPVLIHAQLASREQCLEVGAGALENGRDQARLDLAAGGVEGGGELAPSERASLERTQHDRTLFTLRLGTLHALMRDPPAPWIRTVASR